MNARKVSAGYAETGAVRPKVPWPHRLTCESAEAITRVRHQAQAKVQRLRMPVIRELMIETTSNACRRSATHAERDTHLLLPTHPAYTLDGHQRSAVLLPTAPGCMACATMPVPFKRTASSRVNRMFASFTLQYAGVAA